METHQKDIEEKDPFGQNRRADEDDEDDDEKSFLKALLAERALKNTFKGMCNYLSTCKAVQQSVLITETA